MYDRKTKSRLYFLYYIYFIAKCEIFDTIIKNSYTDTINTNIRCFLVNGFRVVFKLIDGTLNNIILQHRNKNIGEYFYGKNLKVSYVDDKGDTYEVSKAEQIMLDKIISVMNENIENLQIEKE